MRPRAGDLRHEIRFDSFTTTQDSYGDITQTWTEHDTVRAAIEPVSGREYFDAAAINEELTVRFRLRHLAGLDTSMRIVDVQTSEVYNIQSILNPKRLNDSLEIIGTLTNDEAE